MNLTTFSFLGVLVVAHVVNVFASWVIHYVQHQRLLGVDLYRIHLEGHHAPDRHVSTPGLRRFWSAANHVLWALLILLLWAVYYVVLPEWAAATFMAEGVVLSIGVYYLHREYENPNAWLNRFAWFTRARTLHEVHHRHHGDFSRSINYAIGGPLVGALPDRFFSTLREAPDVGHAAAGLLPLDAPAAVVAAAGPGPSARAGDDGSRSPGHGSGADAGGDRGVS